MTQTERPLFRRVRRQLDLEPHAWEWLRTGKPASLKWLGWLDRQGRQIGRVEEVWKRHADQIIAELVAEKHRPYVFDYFGMPVRRRGETNARYLDRISKLLQRPRQAEPK
jgi:hypothetical protein